MAIPTDYPHGILPDPLIGKQRSVMQKFDTRENFDGKSIVRPKRDFSTVYFDVSFLIAESKKQLFALWLTKVDKGQNFKISLKTEGGFNEYTVHWTVVPENPREFQGYYTYQGTLYADQLLQGFEGATEADLNAYWKILVDGGVNPLAITVNENWPS
ncbi:MAG: hypothetical protein Unbinned6437contig1000_22 [Prokaryotic dsDNA virus sp.]|nr:MAG: hypothetical protein Unbinned6437contig1000_22 [Prokaryotic dsDNA virus sp.]|tara:strand:- start:31913 stop:32383 length:471 start_codon:yes stop_codon:yes gene_type:complete